MRKRKYTKGPWHTGLAGVFAPISSERNVMIAEVWNDENARLIAAAPDLIDVMRRVLEIYGNESTFDGATKAAITNAIAKAEADGGTLIAMATHGRSGLNRFMLGSVAEKVLRGSANPLVLVRAKETLPSAGVAGFKTVIVPLDGSELAESAIPMAVAMAKTFDLEMVLFRAIKRGDAFFNLPDGSYIELACPTGADSAVGKALESRGAERDELAGLTGMLAHVRDIAELWRSGQPAQDPGAFVFPLP